VNSEPEDSTNLQRAKHKVKVGSPRVVFSLLGTVTLLVSIALGAAWKTVDSIAIAVTSQAVSDPIVSVASPIISARRAPATLSTEIRLGTLRRELVQVSRSINSKSCLVVDIEDKQMVTVNPTALVTPASNMKIVVAAAAIKILGDDFVFETQLRGIQQGQTIAGDLWLIGGGDPLLTSESYSSSESLPTFNSTSIEELADLLIAAGVTTVSGSIIADESRYDDERFAPSLGLGIRTTEVGPLGALMINDGAVTGNPIKPNNPAFAAAQEFTNILKTKGVIVNGSAGAGTAAADVPVVAKISSRPLVDVLAEMLTNSDNNTAELVLKEIGLQALQTGTREAGAQAALAFLNEQGFDTTGVVITDGSGLDRGNLLTCSIIQQLLLADGGFGSLGSGLAVAGSTGTLRDIFIDSSAAQRLRAKTGTLTGIKALAGFVSYGSELASTFTVILNGSGVSNQSVYRPIWNGLAEALASFSNSPSASEISPSP
jgi:D-alanyl-D-alanine carboxypeptidase/D-alanyl-D-alanine-endopeptidase (penicillin-binding protein 4)